MQRPQYGKYIHTSQKCKEKNQQLLSCSVNYWFSAKHYNVHIQHNTITGWYTLIGELKGKGCSSTVAGVKIITHFFFPPVWEYNYSNTISPTAVLLVMLLVS